MPSLKGTYRSQKKNGSIYYRSSITYNNKHISLGSYNNEYEANAVYNEASDILFKSKYKYTDYSNFLIPFEKWITLHNYRDNGYYIKTPIYMHKYYFSYFVHQHLELEFDVDDLFYYSNHKIMKRGGYLFVNDYGMQINILSRYGIKNFAKEGRDYYFDDSNSNNFRYHNIVIINKYYGVEKKASNNTITYSVKINVVGNYTIGKYRSEEKAAIAYNKAADYINANKISTKIYPRNYIEDMSTLEYRNVYNSITLPIKLMHLTH